MATIDIETLLSRQQGEIHALKKIIRRLLLLSIHQYPDKRNWWETSWQLDQENWQSTLTSLEASNPNYAVMRASIEAALATLEEINSPPTGPEKPTFTVIKGGKEDD